MYRKQGLSVNPYPFLLDGVEWTPPMHGHYEEAEDWESGSEGDAFYLLDTLFEVASVLEAWGREAVDQDNRDCGFSWSYAIYARRSGRILLHVWYHEDPGINV